MSVLDDLLSVPGLITLSISSVLTIKSLRFTWFGDSTNISVNGNNNIIIYNDSLKNERGSYRLLWNFLAVIVICAYPAFPRQLNSVFNASAHFAVLIAIAGTVATVRRFGMRGIFPSFYVAASLMLLSLALSAQDFLPYTADQASSAIDSIKSLPSYVTAPLGHHETIATRAGALAEAILPNFYAFIAIASFATLLLSTWYIGFGFINTVTFDGSLRHSLTYGMLGIMGYAGACNILLALHNRKFDYVWSVIRNALP